MSNHSYANPDVLISTQWLADYLHDDGLRIVEVDMAPQKNEHQHIPGAVFWGYFTDILKPNFAQNLEPAAIQDLLARTGITPDTTIVAYGSELGTSTWIFWLLTTCGHKNVRVLNGGLKKWISEQRPLLSQLSEANPVSYSITPTVDSSLRITYGEIQANEKSQDPSEPVFLDVRTAAEYNGEIFMQKPPENGERAGHIPGAVHIPHELNFQEDGTFKSVEALSKLYAEAGITPDKTIVPYCAIGARSAHVWFVLTHLLGYPNVRNYDGSWNEWSRIPEAPVE
ncbi:MAG: sulfurtransferase [Cyanobacteria bacterium J06632_3]